MLVCTWDAVFADDLHMVPDGCVELMWLDRLGVVVCGPETGTWPVVHREPAEGCGVRFRPGWGPALLGVPADAMADRRVALGDLIDPARARRLEHRVEEATRGRRSTVLVEAVRADLARGTDRLRPLFNPVGLVEGPGGVAGLADALGVTTRTVQRSSRRSFGYGPSTLRSIIRLQRALAWHKADPGLGPAGLAAVAGYADQSHLGRDAKTLSGLTTSRLLSSPSSDWHGDGAVVALPAAVSVRSVPERRWHPL